MDKRNRRRMQLIGVGLVFALPLLAAMILSAMGWHPGTRSHGEPILPQRSFASVNVRLDDGSRYPWRDSEPRMTLVALAGPHCARNCVRTLALMRNARITLNDKQDRLRLLYIGTPPADPRTAPLMAQWQLGDDVAGAFARWQPRRDDEVAALLVESNGTALLHYPAGFDVNGLRKDLQKVVRK
ncbi:MAG TPA: hypothetical protein VFG73_03745 [Rhodanobacteraceae bacterium]|nr:hypothetical protein [Rhodanobacteraceae bacterium]